MPRSGTPLLHRPEIRAGEIEAKPANLKLCADPRALEPHCEAVKALHEFIESLGLSSTSSPFPSCDPALIPKIDPMNLKVTAAIDFHKLSDGVLHGYGTKGPLEPLDKSTLTQANDEAIRKIVRILQQYFYGHDASGSDYAPLIHYAELVRLAEQVLHHNFKLALWGVDARFLAGARGYAVYQYVFNCIRTRDFRLVAEQMSARAHAVWLAAVSQSYFGRVGKNNQLLHRPDYWRWIAETQIIERFPPQIFLGSTVQNPGSDERCRDISTPIIKNYYGFLTQKKGMRLIEGRDEFTYTAYDPASPDIEENSCQTAINSRNAQSANALVIPGLARWPVAGTKDRDDFHDMLLNISNAINTHEKIVTGLAGLAECTSSPSQPPRVACEALKQWILASGFPQLQRALEQQGSQQEETEQQNQIGYEFDLLEELSADVRDVLSPAIKFEEKFEEPRDRR